MQGVPKKGIRIRYAFFIHLFSADIISGITIYWQKKKKGKVVYNDSIVQILPRIPLLLFCIPFFGTLCMWPMNIKCWIRCHLIVYMLITIITKVKSIHTTQ